jgi:hypothetical protein
MNCVHAFLLIDSTHQSSKCNEFILVHSQNYLRKNC